MNLATTRIRDRVWECNSRFEAVLPAIAEALDKQAGAVFKESPARIVVRIDLGKDGAFFAKSYRTPTWLDKTKLLIQESKGKREWENLNRAWQQEIPVPEPVAYCERREGGFLAENFLVTAELAGAAPFLDFVEQHYDCFTGFGDLQHKRHIIRNLAALVGRLYQAGIVHHDFQPRNVLFHPQTDEFSVLDFSEVTFTGEQSPADLQRRMAQFGGYFQLYGSRLDRCYFLKKLFHCLTLPATEFPHYQRAMEAEAGRWNLDFWMSRRDRAFESNRDYEALQFPEGEGMVVRAAFVPYPEWHRVVRGEELTGPVLKDGRSTRVVAIPLQTRDPEIRLPVVMKTYKAAKSLHHMKNLFRRSRAAKSWQAALDFQLRRVDTPRALMFLDLGSSGESLFVCEDLRQHPKIYEEYRRLLDAGAAGRWQRIRLVQDFAADMARMHRRGLMHGDLKGDNVFVVEKSGRRRFYYIDIDRASVSDGFSERRSRRDLAQLNREFMKWAPPQDRLRFLRAYLAGIGRSWSECRTWAAAVSQRTRVRA